MLVKGICKSRVRTVLGFFAFCLVIMVVLSSIQELIAFYAGHRRNEISVANTGNIFRVGQPHESETKMIMALAANADINPEENAVETVAENATVSVSAQSAILIDAISMNIIYENNAYKRLPMASTTKIFTAITAIESGVNLDKVITITKKMTGAEGSSVYLYEGEKFTLLDLLYALLLNSANDSAEAIAIGVAGSIENFAEMMNAKMRELNLSDTNLVNPHGLDADMHYTTSRDLALVTAYALENEIFKEIVGTQSRTIYPKNDDGTDNNEGARYLRNHNKLLKMYPDAIGVKTGYTKRSGRCLVSAAEKDGTRLVAVTINASNDWNDHMSMLDYGFEYYTAVKICEKFEYQFELNVVNGVRMTKDEYNRPVRGSAEKIKCANASDEFASLPSYVKQDDIECTVELAEFVYAPVKKNDILGRIIFTYKGEIIGYSAIVSLEDVQANEYRTAIQRFFDFFRKDSKNQ